MIHLACAPPRTNATPNCQVMRTQPYFLRLIYAEATRSGITPQASATEMNAIAFTVINRAAYLQDNPKVPTSYFGATSRSIPGVITPSQFGGVSSPNFATAGNPAAVGTLDPNECDFLKNAIGAAQNALAGTTVDPFDAFGGVFAFRTTGHGSPGRNFFGFPWILGSGNNFYGLR